VLQCVAVCCKCVTVCCSVMKHITHYLHDNGGDNGLYLSDNGSYNALKIESLFITLCRSDVIQMKSESLN